MQKCTKITDLTACFGRWWKKNPASVSEAGFCSGGFPVLLGFPHPCGVISGKGYAVPMTVMLFTLPMSIVPLQDEVSVVMPSS